MKKPFEKCPIEGCDQVLLYTVDGIGYLRDAVCAGSHQFTAMARGLRRNGVCYLPEGELLALVDFRAVFHNTCNRLQDTPGRFFGGIRELVRRLADERDQDCADRGVECNGNPMRQVDKYLESKGYGIGYGGC